MQNHRKFPAFFGLTLSSLLILSIMLIFTAVLFVQPARAAEVTLAWDANTEPDLAGYKVYWGTASRSYQNNADVGNQTTYTVTGLSEGVTYYFAATAYDIYGNESGYSNEVVYTVPGFPEMSVAGNGQNIADGDATPSTGDHTDFGLANVSGDTVTRTYTISNTGTGDLSLTGSPPVAVSGTNAGDFTVTAQPSSPVPPGGSTTFQVSFDPGAEGLRTAGLSVPNDDSDENPYNFSIQGTGGIPPEPEMVVLGNGQNIADGDSTPSASDHTDFGSVSLLGGTVARTYTVSNTGNADLVLSGSPRVALSGAHAADFTVTAQPASPVAAGGGTTFQVTFEPGAEGLRSASVSVANNDGDENPYNFSIQGSGSMPAETVASPGAPDGPSNGYTVTLYSYSTGGSSTNYGDEVQYLLDWGDGTDSGWLAVGTATTSKMWTQPGTYLVRAKARCAQHTGVESDWSGSLSVAIVRDTNPPVEPRGLRIGQR